MEYNETVVKNTIYNETIYTYLKRVGFSENYLKNLRKKEGYILLNNQVAFTNAKIKNGDIIKTCKNPNCTTTSIMHCIIQLDIVYEDEDILIVNKPSNLSTSASRSHYSNNLSGAILNYMQQKDKNFVVRIINRLDKDTAGLVVIAKHSLCAKILNSSNITKTYYAIVEGIINNNLVINKKIETTTNTDGYNNHKRVISDFGKDAITYVYPVINDGKNTLCKIQIVFGRTHQIRVHLSSIGHPLLGDNLYGNISNYVSHTALVCKDIEFTHPFNNKKIHICCNFPQDFVNAFKAPFLLN